MHKEPEMPLYEFECLKCGAEFEKLVRTSSPEEEVSCPKCGSRNIDEKISAFASWLRDRSCAPGGG